MNKRLKYRAHEVLAVVNDKEEHQQKFWMRNQFYEADGRGLLKYLYENVDRSGIAIDCGACIGNHTLFFAGVLKFPEVISFEPNKKSFNHLVENISLNKFDNVFNMNKALGDSAKEVSMIQVNSKNVGMSTVNESGLGTQMTTLDSVIITPDKVSYIKIDVEGYNLEIIKGAHNLLANTRAMISAECDTDKDLNETNYALSQYGYKLVPNLVLNATPTYIWTK